MANNPADIIIIGAGAAGLMAATAAALTTGHCRRRIIVLEKMQRPGRKIMITGKGRCNFTNLKPWNEFCGHIHPKANFLKPAFFNLTPEKLMDFFRSYGMESTVGRGDRAFPASQSATEVIDTLVKAARHTGAEILCGKEVCGIDFMERFTVTCKDGSTFSCGKLIICTGGLSYPGTGSTGDGYGWATEAGHAVTATHPSLTALVPKGYKTENSRGHISRNIPLSDTGTALCGNMLKNVGLSLDIDGNTVQTEFGDIEFTDGGIEGPIGFKVSRRCVKAIINGGKAGIVLDLKPAVSTETLSGRILSLWEEISKDRRSTGIQYKDKFKILLGKMLPQQLITAFVKCNPEACHKTLAKVLKNWKFDIAGFVGYERCVITAGGVSLDQITAKTLESKLVPGLYFAGEVLDIDADTGGYNLHVAFSTGHLAGMSAARSLQSDSIRA